MIALEEERTRETKALVQVVSQLEKLSIGVMTQSFTIKKSEYVENNKIEEETDDTQNESDEIALKLKEARMREGDKKKLID
jgi:hypothetical protein